MRVFISSALVFVLASSALGAPPQKGPSNSGSTQVLTNGLQAMVLSSQGKQASAEGQSSDRSQGADHAASEAILKVCSHHNPSARNAAICPKSVSPD